MSPNPTAPSTCPQCGAQGTGRFCATCGSPLPGARCRSCDQPLTPGVKFCASCGQPVSAAAAVAAAPAQTTKPSLSLGTVFPYVIGGAALLVLLVALFRKESQTRAAISPAPAAATPALGAGGNGAPPDIANMSPRERFDRLYNRVMQASESGDTAQASQFLPMAMQAYADLPDPDADARYHSAMLRLHTGDLPGARALADTILANDSTHLFGFMIEGALAQFTRNDAALAKAYQGFNAAYDKEIAAGRPEYRDHQTAVDRFLAEARAAVKAKR
jgi:Double zinc ribbon